MHPAADVISNKSDEALIVMFVTGSDLARHMIRQNTHKESIVYACKSNNQGCSIKVCDK